MNFYWETDEYKCVSYEYSKELEMHIIEWDGLLLTPEQGMLLGNGDLSVSVYQNVDRIIWRFGKGDIWDRRLDHSKDPRPAHIEELAHGLEVERWSCGPYGGPVEALNGTANKERMREICQGVPPSYKQPFPMPKPVGELAFWLPADFRRLKLLQTLYIEEARLEIICTWGSGEKLIIDSMVLPDNNVLAVNWRLENSNPGNKAIAFENEYFAPCVCRYFDLYRHPDTTYEEFADKNSIENPMHRLPNEQETLPLPKVKKRNGTHYIEQVFHPEKTFPEGFSYRLTPFTDNGNITEKKLLREKTAQIRIASPRNATSGTVFIHLATSLSHGGSENNQEQAIKRYVVVDYASCAANNLTAAKAFWDKAAIDLNGHKLEKVWYETLHIQRSIYGCGKVPPGLMLPSTIGDYARWHGDYHSNYNFQSPFWGMAAANHPELLESYFQGAEFFHQIGRKIAHDYYNCRGAFIQLTAYPIEAEDDYLGCCPMGRMAYMTGWLWHLHWEYYTYTLDREFLKERCWPLLRDCALFYTDFMKKGNDGLYHAFPSNCGEDGFNGDPSYYRDRKEVLSHARFTLETALKAAAIIDNDEFTGEWQERLAYWPEISQHDVSKLKVKSHSANPPEFNYEHWIDAMPDSLMSLFSPGHEFWTWYSGHLPMAMLMALRNNLFIPQRDFENFCKLIDRWREPNGTITAMSSILYGRTGAWTETLGIIGAVQEMLLQSWRGFIEVFPAWPKNVDARFRTLRAEGAFLVSAEYRDSHVVTITVHSENGGICRIKNPWRGQPVTVTPAIISSDDEIIVLNTLPGMNCVLSTRDNYIANQTPKTE